MMKKAIVLLSGGIDSATCCAFAANEGYAIYALSFAYGQRHKIELDAARKIAGFYNAAEHRIVTIGLDAFGGSSLTTKTPVPKNRDVQKTAIEIPSTYVPARNTIFLSYALAWAEVIDCREIFIGVNAIDYSGYPDCRPEYIAAFETMANLATRSGVDGNRLFIRSPLLTMTKSQIIKRGASLGLDYSLTHSCYDPDPKGRACGTCDSCIIRQKGFLEAGVADPTQYQK
ncbi:MAG: 7-cyano-7-deazaguanine synthase QueC [Chitinispirillaceae bacterium]|jgi:7-cyano-7-deazaguanine synthase|nr:7-cyano-7-deazaguanine synthase QueC [Chitinispirillaceae bacterium]